MKICSIAAVSNNGVIGSDGSLPWHYPKDLEHFRDTTENNVIIMGRKTYDSFPEPLDNRYHIVLTRDTSLDSPFDDVEYVNSVDEAIALAESMEDEISYVIGGQSIYKLFFTHIDEMILTEIDKEYDGDTYYPEFDTEEWHTNILERYDEFDIVKYSKDK